MIDFPRISAKRHAARRILGRLALIASLTIPCTVQGGLVTEAWGRSHGGAGVCDGLSGAARGLCGAYCEAQDCDVRPRPSCEELRRNFAKHTGSPIFPCDPPPATATAVPVVTATPSLRPTPASTATPGGCDPLACPPVCGNGILEPGEACDPPGSGCPDGQACAGDCSCPSAACEPIRPLRITSADGSDLDYGFTGIAHDQSVPAASSATFDLACNGNDCDVTGVTPPTAPFLSPLPLSAGGVPTCIVSTVRGPVTGTYDCDSGCGETEVPLRWDVFLVPDVAKPCPLCLGDAVPGDGLREGVCDGGRTPGAPCDESGVSASFGPVSNDCLPAGSSVGELAVDLAPLTTGAVRRDADRDCVSPLFPPGACYCDGQIEPNSCSDGVCGPSGVCENGPIDGLCSNERFHPCRVGTGTADCEDIFPGSGECIEQPRPCFGASIERAGECGREGGSLVSVFCVPATRAAAINATVGLPGPAALVLPFETDGCFCEEQGNAPPDCNLARATPATLWPPNHKLVPVSIAGVTDPDGDPVAITVNGIAQDEPLDGRGDGRTCPDANGVGTSSASLRAERAGPLDGRVYHVSFVADDGRGGLCEGTVAVCVPHDRGRGRVCGDQGPLVDATGPCEGSRGRERR